MNTFHGIRRSEIYEPSEEEKEVAGGGIINKSRHTTELVSLVKGNFFLSPPRQD
jgi:hypothetical protein